MYQKLCIWAHVKDLGIGIRGDSVAGNLTLACRIPVSTTHSIQDVLANEACMRKMPHFCDDVESCKPFYKLSTFFFFFKKKSRATPEGTRKLGILETRLSGCSLPVTLSRGWNSLWSQSSLPLPQPPEQVVYAEAVSWRGKKPLEWFCSQSWNPNRHMCWH